jgi:hypothetical protein
MERVLEPCAGEIRAASFEIRRGRCALEPSAESLGEPQASDPPEIMAGVQDFYDERSEFLQAAQARVAARPGY